MDIIVKKTNEEIILKDLKDTVDLMTSNDYKDRFIAEYAQLSMRLDKLSEIMEEEIPNTLNCPTGILNLQFDKMAEYSNILNIRCELEDIDIDYDFERDALILYLNKKGE